MGYKVKYDLPQDCMNEFQELDLEIVPLQTKPLCVSRHRGYLGFTHGRLQSRDKHTNHSNMLEVYAKPPGDLHLDYAEGQGLHDAFISLQWVLRLAHNRRTDVADTPFSRTPILAALAADATRGQC